VHFSISGNGGAVPPADYTFVTSDAGVHSFAVTGFVANSNPGPAGFYIVTATDTVLSSVTGSTSVTVTPAALAKFAIFPLINPVPVGMSIITVQPTDAFGNFVPNYTGNIHFSSTDPHATLPADQTFVPGIFGGENFTVTFQTAGTQTLTVTDTTTSSLTGSGTITLTPGAATHFSVAAPGSTTAGVSIAMTVIALDQFGNVATGYTGTVHFNSTDPQAVLPVDYQFAAADMGVHTFSVTLKSAGTLTQTVMDTIISSITGTATVTVNPATASHFTVTTPATATIGVAFNVTVTALDPFNNVATSYLGTVHFSSTDNQAALPADYSFVASDNGSHSFTLTLNTAGSQTVTVTDTSTATISGTTIVAVTSQSPAVLPFYAATFPGHGVWRYQDSTGWQQLLTIDAAQVAVDSQGNVIAEFTGNGLWRFSDATSWQQILPFDANLIAVDGAGTVFAQSNNWQILEPSDVSALAVNHQGDIAADFTGHGVWRFEVATGSWQQLLSLDASQVALDGSDNVVAEFQGFGLWQFTDATSWQRLSSADASSISANSAGQIAAEFPNHGVWRFDPVLGFQQLMTTDATQVSIDNNGAVIASFVNSGVWRFSLATGWVQLTPGDASWLACDI
jgi:hypothetical protein